MIVNRLFSSFFQKGRKCGRELKRRWRKEGWWQSYKSLLWAWDWVEISRRMWRMLNKVSSLQIPGANVMLSKDFYICFLQFYEYKKRCFIRKRLSSREMKGFHFHPYLVTIQGLFSWKSFVYDNVMRGINSIIPRHFTNVVANNVRSLLISRRDTGEGKLLGCRKSRFWGGKQTQIGRM